MSTYSDEDMKSMLRSWKPVDSNLVPEAARPKSGFVDVQRMDMREILDYEIRASWWAGWVGITPLQDLAGKYFAWKVRRKYARWVASRDMGRRVKAHIAELCNSPEAARPPGEKGNESR